MAKKTKIDFTDYIKLLQRINKDIADAEKERDDANVEAQRLGIIAGDAQQRVDYLNRIKQMVAEFEEDSRDVTI